MSTQLIAHLRKKCELDDNVKILLSQWEFDQKLVGKALENIAGFYPHFSNHNASHSQQILINIERILGKNIELLSGTDTWLILEAAYWHDVGMLVDATDAKKVHSDPDFNFMIKTIANDNGHDLNAFCKAYEQGDWAIAIGSEDHPFDGVEKYRQLIAEWFRRNHDKRIGSLVTDPFLQLGISSPRTELLPNRLYRYLGQICMSHGMSFENVIEHLPYKQTGLGIEDCHPRFIGCLLRLGDLFDLDDNRFCPVMAKHVSNMPSVSQCHKDKHLSLREFQLDKKTVKLVAECSDEMSYIETQNWFGWIREEFQNQMSQWNLIVPNLDFGSLPTIEQLDVRMKGNKVLLNNKPMKFSIDENHAIEILEGSGIYKKDTNIFRELIQNAIDATLMKVWMDSEQGIISLPKKAHPFAEKTQEILKNYPIKISFTKIEDIIDTDDSWWEIIIEDKGVGISLNCLKYMQKIAGSSRNIERQKIIERMPKWMKPSGEFGIGLHSAFLLLKNLSDQDQKITIISKNNIDYQSYKVEMNSPLTNKKGYCFIEKMENSISEVGTQIILKIKKRRRGRAYSFNPSKIYKCLYIKHDPIKEEAFDLFSIATEIENIVNEVLRDSFLKFDFNEPWNKLVTDNLIKAEPKINKGIWLEKYSLYISFWYHENFSLSDLSGHITGGFKGQRVTNISYDNQPFSFYLMFYGLNAKETLHTSRNDWKSSFKENFWEKNFLHEICNEIIINHSKELNKILPDDNVRSLFLYEFGKNSKSSNDWKNLPLFSLPNENYKFKNKECNLYDKSYNEILAEESFNYLYIDSYSNSFNGVLESTDITLPYRFNDWCKKLFNDDWIKSGGSIIEEKINNIKILRYKKIDNPQGINTQEVKVSQYILNCLNWENKRINFNSDWLSNPFFEKFPPLFTKSKLVERLVGFSNLDKGHLILPFYIQTDASDCMSVKIDYLFENQIVKDTWASRSEEFIDLNYEDYLSLYTLLEKEICQLMEKHQEWKIIV